MRFLLGAEPVNRNDIPLPTSLSPAIGAKVTVEAAYNAIAPPPIDVAPLLVCSLACPLLFTLM